jgi:hypothetical protein
MARTSERERTALVVNWSQFLIREIFRRTPQVPYAVHLAARCPLGRVGQLSSNACLNVRALRDDNDEGTPPLVWLKAVWGRGK